MTASSLSVAWLAIALAFSCAGRSSGPHSATFPAACTWVHLVLPNPIRTALFAAWSIGPAPCHDHCTKHVLAWKVLYLKGITGKAVVGLVLKEVGEGSARSAGSCGENPGRALPDTEELCRS